ncbi:MAG: thioesterase family protein [Candidatus Bathycorpusculaceae bacterium]
MEQKLKTGLTLTAKYAVETEHAAKAVGSGEVEVLSTPAMIAFMENTALHCVREKLPKGFITVGFRVDVKHLRPVLVGEEIIVTAQLTGIEERKLKFKVKAEWRNEVVGEGQHERVVVHHERFLQRLKEKMQRTL